MKKLFALVMGVSMLGLVAGCSDDSSDDPGNLSCNFASTSTCMTAPIKDSDCTGLTGTVVSSCPASPLLTCDEGSGVTMNYYDQAMVDALKTANAADPCGAGG